MFKLTGSGGLRRAGSGGVAQAARVGGLASHQGPAPTLHRPAYLPDTPQEQTMDSNSPRLSGLERR